MSEVDQPAIPLEGRRAPSRALPLALLAAFAGLATVETVQAVRGPRAVAADADWTAAANEVRASFRPGDLIVFAPYWADQTGRSHLGDLVTPAMAGRADADRYGRVWEVSIRGARAPETADARLLHATDHGRVRVALHEKAPPVEVTFDFTARLDDARVTQQRTDGRGDETPCYRQPEGFQCAGTRVERRTLEVDYGPRRGVLAPADGALTTRIEFPDARLGATLVGHTALHDYFSRKNADGPVDLALFVDGKRVHAVRHHNGDGWRRFTVATTPGTHAVRFEVSAERAAWRTFGFHVEARK